MYLACIRTSGVLMDLMFMGLDGIWPTRCKMKYLCQNQAFCESYTLQKTQFSFNLTSDASKRNIIHPFYI